MDENFRDFTVDALQVLNTVVRTMSITDIIRVRTSPQGSVYKETLVTFQEANECNFYFSKARNLAEFRDPSGNPTVGMRMGFPPFLLPTFKMLNDHGYEIKKVNGPDTKRYVKFDDDNLSLYLEIRLPGQSKWIKVRPEQARAYTEDKDKQEYSSIKRSLLRNSTSNINAGAFSLNQNFIPIGPRITVGLAPPAAPVNQSRWCPPARDSNTKRSSDS